MPSNVIEFNACDSHYKISEKYDSEAISSDGEFDDAKNMQVFNEDATEVLKIELVKSYQKTHF